MTQPHVSAKEGTWAVYANTSAQAKARQWLVSNAALALQLCLNDHLIYLR